MLVADLGLGLVWAVAAYAFFFDELPLGGLSASKVEDTLEVLRRCFLGLTWLTIAAAAVWAGVAAVRRTRRGHAVRPRPRTK
jgi:hypothetical protein